MFSNKRTTMYECNIRLLNTYFYAAEYLEQEFN